MSVHLPTLKQLQYLVALRRYEHFGKAAEACFVTQSTLSAGLRELEALLGITLVERTRRLVRFTALGEKIAEKAIRVLREAEELAEMARAEGQPLHGELRMGVIPTIAPFLLPAMLPRLRSEWPDLKLYLREETSNAACEALHRGQLDCVLLALPDNCRTRSGLVVYRPALRRLPAGRTPRGPPWKQPRSMEPAVAARRGHCLKDHALSACNRPEWAQASMMGTSLHTLVQMVDNGLGLTFVPGMAIETGILRGTNVEAKRLKSDHGFPGSPFCAAEVRVKTSSICSQRRSAGSRVISFPNSSRPVHRRSQRRSKNAPNERVGRGRERRSCAGP